MGAAERVNCTHAVKNYIKRKTSHWSANLKVSTTATDYQWCLECWCLQDIEHTGVNSKNTNNDN